MAKGEKIEAGHALALMVSSMQMELDLFQDFAEEVLLMCSMPDKERFVMQGKFEGHLAEDALRALMNLLRKYHALTSFLRANHIDVDKLLSGPDDEIKS